MPFHLEFIVSGRPLAKARVRFASGHAYTPERTLSHEARIAAAAQEAMNGRPPVEGPVAVVLDIRMPIPGSWPRKRQFLAEIGLLRPIGRPDTDNFIKTLDALNHIVWVDDAQIVTISAFKRYDISPGISVTVDGLTGESSDA